MSIALTKVPGTAETIYKGHLQKSDTNNSLHIKVDKKIIQDIGKKALAHYSKEGFETPKAGYILVVVTEEEAKNKIDFDSSNYTLSINHKLEVIESDTEKTVILKVESQALEEFRQMNGLAPKPKPNYFSIALRSQKKVPQQQLQDPIKPPKAASPAAAPVQPPMAASHAAAPVLPPKAEAEQKLAAITLESYLHAQIGDGIFIHIPWEIGNQLCDQVLASPEGCGFQFPEIHGKGFRVKVFSESEVFSKSIKLNEITTKHTIVINRKFKIISSDLPHWIAEAAIFEVQSSTLESLRMSKNCLIVGRGGFPFFITAAIKRKKLERL